MTSPLTRPTYFRWPLAQALLAFTVAVLVVYTYGVFDRSLVLGFDWSGAEYRIEWALPTVPVQPGDLLIQLGSIKFSEFARHLRQPLLDEVQPGRTLPITIERNGERVTFAYTAPGFTPEEFWHRFFNQGWLGWLFWGTGLLTYASLRPKDTRWRLLIAFFCLTAIWLSASTLSRLHLWESAIVLRMAVWMCVPVYWHLHWIFPERLSVLRRFSHAPMGRGFGYAAAGVLAVLEWLQLLPVSWYVAGFGLAFLGLLVPLVVRLFSKVQARRVRVLWVMLLIAVAPALALAVFAGSGGSTLNALVSLLGLPMLLIGYFYTAYRPQLGWLELRANRLIALLLFGLAMSVVAALALPLLLTQAAFTGAEVLVAVVCVVVAGIAAAAGFPVFQRWVERRLLGIPFPPRHLLGRFLANITASLDRATLARVLSDEIAPSLQITQSALLTFVDDREASWLYTRNTASTDLPNATAIEQLLARAGRYRAQMETDASAYAWVRVALRLAVEEKTVGLWLLGRRDPDDIFAQAEIEYLQVLANQTALALTTLAQTEQLQQLYQTDIDQRETERTQLARDLHDVVLNNLASLRHSLGPNPPLGYLDAYTRAVTSLRQTISGLRPPLLDYGLYQALKALAGDHDYRDDEPLPTLVFNVRESEQRYDSKVEEQVYRIVQQAYENALQHANAGALAIRGELAPGSIDLVMEDDGIGLAVEASESPASSNERKRFGLRGMRERAALIGAELEVTRVDGRGTRVRVRWAKLDPQTK